MLSMSSTSMNWRRRAKPLLGTLVEVSLQCANGADFECVSACAFDRLTHYQRLMSFHEAASDVRAITGASAGQRVRIAPETWAVLEAALRFEAESHGIFNVAVAPDMVRRDLLPSPRPFAAELATSACAALRLDADNVVTVLHPVWVDLGGIAKGAAVDAALAAVRDAGAMGAIVNAGGDIACYGAEDQAIEVIGPHRRRVTAGQLGDGAIATSGPFETGGPSTLVLPRGVAARWADRAVTVVAPTCMVADALTKILAVLGAEAAPLLARHQAQGFAVDAEGRVQRTGLNA